MTTPEATLDADVLVIGSGAGGAATAATLAAAGRDVTVVEEGPWIDPDALEPFSLEEMAAKYRHRGLAAALGNPAIAFAEGRCVGGSTEINSGLYHRLPAALAESWRHEYGIDEFSPETLDAYAQRIENELTVSRRPGAPPPSSALLERGATKLGWQAVEYARVFRYDAAGRGVKQTMTRTLLPRAIDAGATVIPNCRVRRLLRRDGRVTGIRCQRTENGVDENLTIRAEHVFVCAGAIQTPALLQRSGIRAGGRNERRGRERLSDVEAAEAAPGDGHGDVVLEPVADDHLLTGADGRRLRLGRLLLDGHVDDSEGRSSCTGHVKSDRHHHLGDVLRLQEDGDVRRGVRPCRAGAGHGQGRDDHHEPAAPLHLVSLHALILDDRQLPTRLLT